jgi:hypothetical protein
MQAVFAKKLMGERADIIEELLPGGWIGRIELADQSRIVTRRQSLKSRANPAGILQGRAKEGDVPGLDRHAEAMPHELGQLLGRCVADFGDCLAE